MTEIHITRGVPASGKSTFAKAWVAESPTTRVRVNRDNLRWIQGIRDGVGDHEQESYISKMEEAMVELAMVEGKDVIVDATHLRSSAAKRWMLYAKEHGAEFFHHDFPVTYQVARDRDLARGWNGERYVGEEVLKMFFSKYIRKDGALPKLPILIDESVSKSFPAYVADNTLPMAFGFDLDGTLAHMTNRGPYDFTKYADDDVDEAVRAVLYALEAAGYKIIILTGRGEEHRAVVEDWLAKHHVWYDELLMRPLHQPNTNDAIVKSELFDKYIAPKYNFIAQFDDRNRVVDALRSKGIPVFQVAPGNF